MLEAIRRDGSLSQAARSLGMSYRRAWLLIESLNSYFQEPVTLATKGGKGGGGVTITKFEIVTASIDAKILIILAELSEIGPFRISTQNEQES